MVISYALVIHSKTEKRLHVGKGKHVICIVYGFAGLSSGVGRVEAHVLVTGDSSTLSIGDPPTLEFKLVYSKVRFNLKCIIPAYLNHCGFVIHSASRRREHDF